MTAIFTVANGTAWDVSQLNQYASVLNNVFGVTDTNQVNLGRLAAPIATADPGAPTAGQLWLRTNLGLDGRWMTYKNGKTIPLIGMRQRVKTSELAADVNITSTSVTDISATLSVSITTTGGRLKIYLSPSASVATVQGFDVSGTGGTPSSYRAFVTVDVGVVELGLMTCGMFVTVGTPNNHFYSPPSAFVWDNYTPPVGTYTVKLRGFLDVANLNLRVLAGMTLVVEEWDE